MAQAKTTSHGPSATHAHDDHHHEQSFWTKYIFSSDHKVIGIQYGITSLVFLFFGFMLMLVMRQQLAKPNQPIPLVGGLLEKVLGSDMANGGVMQADLYNSFGAMHGTIMVFLAIVPLAFGAFGNFVTPLQI